MCPIPKPLNKNDLKDLMDKLFFYYPTADFLQLIITKYLNFNEIDEFAFKMLRDYVNFQDEQPPYDAPSG